MLTNIFGLLLAGVLGWHAGSAPAWPSTLLDAAPRFKSAERAVSNWRWESALHLDLPPSVALRVLAAQETPSVSRCVRLNNYWCIKRAGWRGEIAADAEGHVAFASAAEGATVAALLLRRYYVDYNRHSAMAIISRWAPPQCGLLVATGTRRRTMPVAARLAPSAIAGTLRGRWLASHSRGGFTKAAGGKALPLRRSIVADRSLAMMPAPTIAVGLGERDVKLAPIRFGVLRTAAATALLPPPSTCAGDGARIRNYALRAIEGIAASPDEDLKLFDTDGTPGASLARLMDNMAKVEIGPLAARGDLIADAIEAAQRQRAQAERDGPKPASP